MSLLQVRDLSVIANNAGRDVTLVDRVSSTWPKARSSAWWAKAARARPWPVAG